MAVLDLKILEGICQGGLVWSEASKVGLAVEPP